MMCSVSTISQSTDLINGIVTNCHAPENPLEHQATAFGIQTVHRIHFVEFSIEKKTYKRVDQTSQQQETYRTTNNGKRMTQDEKDSSRSEKITNKRTKQTNIKKWEKLHYFIKMGKYLRFISLKNGFVRLSRMEIDQAHRILQLLSVIRCFVQICHAE